MPDAMRAELPLTIEHGLPDAGVDRVDGHEIPAVDLARTGPSGRATSSLWLSSRGSFRVATTVPTILARSM